MELTPGSRVALARRLSSTDPPPFDGRSLSGAILFLPHSLPWISATPLSRNPGIS